MASGTNKTIPLVDDPGNIRRFLEVMNQRRASSMGFKPSTITNGVSYSPSPPSNALQSSEVNSASTPSPPQSMAQNGSNESVDGSSLPSGEATSPQLKTWIKENASHNHFQPKSTTPTIPANKLIHSPHTTGVLAPPSTPESSGLAEAHFDKDKPEISVYEITGIIQDEVGKVMDGQSASFSLGQSIHAPRQSPFSQNLQVGPRAPGYEHNTQLRSLGSGRGIDPNVQRSRNESFERMSFAVADAPASPKKPHKSGPSGGLGAVSAGEVGSSRWAPSYYAALSEESNQDRSTRDVSTANDSLKSNSAGTGWIPPHWSSEEELKAPASESNQLPPSSPETEQDVYILYPPLLSRSSTESTVVPAEKPENKNATPPLLSSSWIPPHLRPTESSRSSNSKPQQISVVQPLKSTKSTSTDSGQVEKNFEKQSGATSQIEKVRPAPSVSGASTAGEKSSVPPHLRSMKGPVNVPQQNRVSQPEREKTSRAAETRTSNPFQQTSIKIGGISLESLASSEAQPAHQIMRTNSASLPSPTSMSFDLVSPKSASSFSGATAAIRAANEQENHEGTLFFKAWPKTVDQDRPTSRIRKVILTGIPLASTPTFVTSLVWGGQIERVDVGLSSATVLFLHADDCTKYYDATSNGIVYKKEKEKECVVFVELAKDVDVVGGLLQEMIKNGVTRCVRAIGVDDDWGMEGLYQIASRKGRKVEGIEDSRTTQGARSVTFRFCNLNDAMLFKGVMVRSEDWEHCNIHYCPDPCAAATGVHFT